MCCGWVSAVGVGRGTSAGSECIVTSKCNIKEKTPAHKRVHEIDIGVQGEGSNVSLQKSGEREHMSREGLGVSER